MTHHPGIDAAFRYAAPTVAGVRATTGFEHQRRETFNSSGFRCEDPAFTLCTNISVYRVFVTLRARYIGSL